MSFKQKLKSDLKRTNGLKLIRTTLSTLIYSYMNSEDNIAEQILPTVKDILLDLVDDIWNTGQKIFDRKKSAEDIQKHFSGSLSRQKMSSAFYFIAKPNIQSQFTEFVSEFSYAKRPTFSKSIKEPIKKPGGTPGPVYKGCRSEIMSTPPRVSLPAVSKRNSYTPAVLSPGPGKYYSSLRSVSKP